MNSSNKKPLAIIGTGLSALACADRLARDFDISLFDKSRGLMGRSATRRAGAHEFDHGAQYFRADGAGFAAWLEPFQAAGHVRLWTPRHVTIDATGTMTPRADETPKHVFAPRMSALGKALLAGRPSWRIYLDTPITQVSGTPRAWTLHAEADSFGPFEHVVFALPPEQALALLPEGGRVADDLRRVDMLGCHTLMLGYAEEEAPQAEWDCAHFDDSLLGFAAVNCSKPGRAVAFGVTVQTRHDWSQAHIEKPLDEVAAAIKARFHELTGWPTAASAYDRLHRWRYASTATPAGSPFLLDAEFGLSAIGDWCTGSKLEDAFASGAALADRLNG